jgi:3-dehydroquinate dehydratase/shikimate dehydrogenase
MICISIAQESRRLALADMLNASRQCDLLEVRLDRFDKAPDLGDLLAAKPRPVIMGCRRQCDGGAWTGSEDERLALLRQCIIGKADYVEIEVGAADQIRPFPPTKRVISYTNLSETPEDIADIYDSCRTKHPDVIKLTTLARTPEEAWPLVQILAKSSVPTVVVGLGKPGVMLAVLGQKIGAPWTYAALEKGMEAFPGQPTVHELETIYHYRSIERSTRLIGVTGFGEREKATVAALNAALAHLKLPARCWPLSMGNPRLFRKIVEAVKLAAVVVDAEHQKAALEMAAERDPGAEQAQAADLLLHKNNQWHGYHVQCRAAVAALESTLSTRTPSDQPLKGRMVMVVGVSATARAMAQAIADRGGAVILASHDRDGVKRLALILGCRYVQFEALYSTMHDVLVVCDEERDPKGRASGVHPGYLKPGMTVFDLTAALSKSPLVREAEQRGCVVVGPRQVLLDQLALQARLLTGKEVPGEVLAAALPPSLEEEEPSQDE